MTATQGVPLLEEAAARLPTNGLERSQLLANYQRYHESADLEALSPTAFLHVHRRAREDWEARSARTIAFQFSTFTHARRVSR